MSGAELSLGSFSNKRITMQRAFHSILSQFVYLP